MIEQKLDQKIERINLRNLISILISDGWGWRAGKFVVEIPKLICGFLIVRSFMRRAQGYTNRDIRICVGGDTAGNLVIWTVSHRASTHRPEAVAKKPKEFNGSGCSAAAGNSA